MYDQSLNTVHIDGGYLPRSEGFQDVQHLDKLRENDASTFFLKTTRHIGHVLLVEGWETLSSSLAPHTWDLSCAWETLIVATCMFQTTS